MIRFNKIQIFNNSFTLVILWFLFLIGCTSPKNNESKESVNIGVMMPLTGEGSFWGQNGRKGIELALDQINNRENRFSYNLIIEDSKTEPKTAVSAFTKLVEVDKVNYCLVDMISGNVLAIAPIAERNQVIILSPGASNAKISSAGDYVFRNWPSDALQGEENARIVNDVLGWKNVGILKINNEYGIGLSTVFKENLSSDVTVYEQTYEQGDVNFRAQLTFLKSKNVEGVYLLAYPQEAPNILLQASELNFKVNFLGTETFESQDLVNRAGSAAEGLLYTFPKSPDTTKAIVQNFRSAFRERYNEDFGTPADVAYDALFMLVDAIEKVGDDVKEVKSELYKYQNYSGASGTYSIDSNGDAIKNFDLKTIMDGEFRFYEDVE